MRDAHTVCILWRSGLAGSGHFDGLSDRRWSGASTSSGHFDKLSDRRRSGTSTGSATGGGELEIGEKAGIAEPVKAVGAAEVMLGDNKAGMP